MSVLLDEERPRGQKHHLCKDADTELAYLSERIAAIRRAIPASDFRLLGFGPIDRAGNTVPPIPAAGTLVQERMDAFEETVCRLRCYMAVRKDVEGIPDVGFNGRAWLKGLLKEFRLVQLVFRGLVDDVVRHIMTFFVALGIDAARNPGFYAKYWVTLAAAFERVSKIQGFDDASSEAFVKLRAQQYEALDRHARLIPFATNLGESGMVQMVALLAQINLKRWDRMHGIRVPHVRRILEVLAYDLEPQYRRGNYNLCALFERDGGGEYE